MLIHGRQSKDFGMAVVRTMGTVGAVWSSKESTEKDGSRSAKLEFLWKVDTAMAAELMGVCVLTGILDLVFHKCPVCAEYQPMC